MSAITLTQGQSAAEAAFMAFLADPTEPALVLAGYSGTGKSTLVKHLIGKLPQILDTVRLLCPSFPDYEVVLTATTNKAAEALFQITGQPVCTIHSFLGLMVDVDYHTKQSTLIPKTKEVIYNHLIFIDEASYIDSHLMELIFAKTNNCKIVFMGDPAQLTPVKSSITPVFNAGFPTATLTEVVRQAKGNPIIELSTKFRETVSSGEFFSFRPDGQHVVHLDRDAFNKEILREFSRPDWRHSDSKVLAWRNKTVIAYNHFIRDKVQGTPDFQAGDYAICNNYANINGKKIKTDQTVYISGIVSGRELNVPGKFYHLDNSVAAFMPESLEAKKLRANEARAKNEYQTLRRIESEWVDLRAAYSCTINKAQGSTYDRVFIDLDDVRRCNSGDLLARMLYVAVSRARHQVFLTGDIC